MLKSNTMFAILFSTLFIDTNYTSEISSNFVDQYVRVCREGMLANMQGVMTRSVSTNASDCRASNTEV